MVFASGASYSAYIAVVFGPVVGEVIAVVFRLSWYYALGDLRLCVVCIMMVLGAMVAVFSRLGWLD